MRLRRLYSATFSLKDQPMPDSPDQAPKIIIDSDWKAQAQKEREKLAEKERQEASKKAGAKGNAAGPDGHDQEGMPPADNRNPAELLRAVHLALESL